jgi:hypothetical protein
MHIQGVSDSDIVRDICDSLALEDIFLATNHGNDL